MAGNVNCVSQWSFSHSVILSSVRGRLFLSVDATAKDPWRGYAPWGFCSGRSGKKGYSGDARLPEEWAGLTELRYQ